MAHSMTLLYYCLYSAVIIFVTALYKSRICIIIIITFYLTADNPRRTIVTGQGSGQIIISNAETSDSAVFQCIAKNKYGEEITSVFLNVLGK